MSTSHVSWGSIQVSIHQHSFVNSNSTDWLMLNAARLLPGQIVKSLLLNVAQVSQLSPCNIWTLQKWSKENRNVSLFLIGHSLDWAGWQLVHIIAGVNCLVAIDFEQNLVIKFPLIQWDQNQFDDDSFVLKTAWH